ncbi:uncharacterized protein LOC142573285 isoform X2 [Dermacentor variabilis]|uniref:uncharacterized protein LOC142573285 isoform X2 n=1 Tax=Dermacentor variabilis TaxID=34621 RepID=UPI003F5B6B8E
MANALGAEEKRPPRQRLAYKLQGWRLRDHAPEIGSGISPFVGFSSVPWRHYSSLLTLVSNNKKYSCDLLTPFPHGKPLMSKGYVYYAANRYKDTLYNETGAGTNYAYKKKTQQSSTYELYGIQYTSDKAVDGSHNTDGLKPPYFAHTLDSYWNELFPWWMVDLAQDITVTGIRIRNRKEWGDRLHDFDVRVGPLPITAEHNDVPFKGNTRCYYHEKGGIEDEALVFLECKPCPVRGRYVTIQITQNCTDCQEPLKNVLQLAEVEVFGLP